MAQIDDLIGDLLVSPAWILSLEPNEEIDYLPGNLWSARGGSILRSIVFFRDKLSIPPHYRVWGEHLCTLLRHLSADPFGLCCHPHPLLVGQTNAIALALLMLPEYPYLFPQVVNCFVEFLVDAIGQTSDEREP